MEKASQDKISTEVGKPPSHSSKEAAGAGAVVINVSDIEDETGSIAARALTCGDLDPESSRRVRRKLDAYILPYLCVTYGLQFMDKASLTYSSVYGIIQDTHLTGEDFAWASAMFYFGFMVAQYPGVVIMQKFPVAKFLGSSIMLWGIVLATTAACSSFAGLATARFMLGVTEATISPGFVAMTSIWWTRQEQAARSALWLSFLGVGGVVGSLAVFGIGHVHGSLASWRYIFIVLGSATVAWGIAFLLLVPDGPARVRWLNEEEKTVAVQRVIENKMGTKSRRFVKAQVIEAAMDPKVIVLGLLSFATAIAAGGFAFGALIISGFGFDPLQTTLMMLPYSAMQAITQLGSGLLTARIRNSRLHIASLSMLPPIAGTVLMSQLPADNKWGRVAGFWILGFHPVVFTIMLGLLGTNVAGSTKRSAAWAWCFVTFSAGQIAGPQFFKSWEAPGYKNGIVSMLCSFIITLVLSQVLRIMYVLENRRRDKALASKSEDEVLELKRLSERQGFEDVTDRDNFMFRYAL